MLETKEFRRLGGTKLIKVDTRILAATNRNLEEAVKQGEFREDLYYRLNVVPIRLPPLRERADMMFRCSWIDTWPSLPHSITADGKKSRERPCGCYGSMGGLETFGNYEISWSGLSSR